jgi:hypothetical protein
MAKTRIDSDIHATLFDLRYERSRSDLWACPSSDDF